MSDTWRTHAACRGMDPDLFHAETHDRESQAIARRTCATCVVLSSCREDAIRDTSQLGYAGGLTLRRRAKIRKQRKAERPDETPVEITKPTPIRGDGPRLEIAPRRPGGISGRPWESGHTSREGWAESSRELRAKTSKAS